MSSASTALPLALLVSSSALPVSSSSVVGEATLKATSKLGWHADVQVRPAADEDGGAESDPGHEDTGEAVMMTAGGRLSAGRLSGMISVLGTSLIGEVAG